MDREEAVDMEKEGETICLSGKQIFVFMSCCINGKVKTEDWKYPYTSSCVLELWVIWTLEMVAKVLPHEEA